MGYEFFVFPVHKFNTLCSNVDFFLISIEFHTSTVNFSYIKKFDISTVNFLYVKISLNCFYIFI